MSFSEDSRIGKELALFISDDKDDRKGYNSNCSFTRDRKIFKEVGLRRISS